MSKLVLIRHGESVWNQANRFTGWTDVDLSEKGVQEAQDVARVLKDKGFQFDIAYTSFLKRAIKTLWLVLDEMDQCYLETIKSWRLNERHYGKLQGLNKKETAEKYGEDKVFEWRRSYDTAPDKLSATSSPLVSPYDKYFDEKTIPLSESLKQCQQRVLPFWESQILPALKEGKNTLVVAHGNSLRALVQSLENISEEDISDINIDTGQPLLYKFNDQDKTIQRSKL